MKKLLILSCITFLAFSLNANAQSSNEISNNSLVNERNHFDTKNVTVFIDQATGKEIPRPVNFTEQQVVDKKIIVLNDGEDDKPIVWVIVIIIILLSASEAH